MPARNSLKMAGPKRAIEYVDVKSPFSKELVVLWILLTLGLPALLFYSALRTYRSLEGQKVVYLRSRMAAIAARLETLPAGLAAEQVLEHLDEEPGLLDLAIIEPPSSPDADPLAGLWLGHELFRTASVQVHDQRVFRAYVPFHGPTGLRLARIDLAESSADFLVEPAGIHLWFVALIAGVIIGLSLLVAWSLRRKAEAERRQLELAHLAHIGKLSAVLAHEIRNPLGTIKGFAQLLQEKTSPQYENLLNPILSETARLEDLVKDLLLYGRPTAPSFRATNARILADTVSLHAKRSLDRSPIRFDSSVSDVTFETDPNLLEQALLNLLRNAIEALRERGEGSVRLEAESSGGDIVWRVLDDGPGFSEEAQRRLFEPFYTSKAFGTGLGLSISQKLAVTLGGEMKIGNRPEGGAVVEIRLPVHAPVEDN
jgi:signal transduction histidine kinase